MSIGILAIDLQNVTRRGHPDERGNERASTSKERAFWVQRGVRALANPRFLNALVGVDYRETSRISSDSFDQYLSASHKLVKTICEGVPTKLGSAQLVPVSTFCTRIAS